MYERILVPIDAGDVARRGFEAAFGLAVQLHSTLRLLHVTSDFPFVVEMANPGDTGEYRKLVHRRAEELLQELAEQVRLAGVEVETHVRALKTTGLAAAIVQEAARSRCQLIVMGTNRRRGLARVLVGSVAEEVLRRSAVAVLMIGGRGARAPRKP